MHPIHLYNALHISAISIQRGRGDLCHLFVYGVKDLFTKNASGGTYTSVHIILYSQASMLQCRLIGVNFEPDILGVGSKGKAGQFLYIALQ
jgi:hypothetical protein